MQSAIDKTSASVQTPTNGNGPSPKDERGSTSAVVVLAHSVAGLPASGEPKKRGPKTKPKPMRSRQLYTSATGTVAGTVYFDLPDNTVIRQVVFAVHATSVSAGDLVDIEVSSSATFQGNTNDAQGIIAVAGFQAVGAGSPANVSLTNCTSPVPAASTQRKGDRIYLNIGESGGATWYVRALVWFD